MNKKQNEKKAFKQWIKNCMRCESKIYELLNKF